MPKLIKFRSFAKSWKFKKEKSTWEKDIRKSSPPRPSSFKSSKMKWTPWRRSWRAIWMDDWRSENRNTMNCCRDIKTLKRKLKTSKIWRELSTKKLIATLSRQDLEHQTKAWWHLKWDLRWNNQKWVAAWIRVITTLLQSHRINEVNIYLLLACSDPILNKKGSVDDLNS